MPILLRRLAPVAAILLLGLGAYANSHRGDFVYDDLRQIRDNPAIREPAGVLRGIDQGTVPPNRVVGYFTFAANYSAWGPAVVGYHAVNVAVHLASALLLYSLVQLLLRAPRLAPSALAPHARSLGLAAAALFVTHPIQTQAVSYVVQRLTSLATMLYLLAAVLYLQVRLADEEPARGRLRQLALYALSLGAALLAVRTKEIAFTLPVALLLTERLVFGSLSRRRWLRLLPFAGLALLIPISIWQAAGPAGQIVGDADRLARVQTAIPRLDYLRSQIPVVADYLGLLAWPTGQNVDHDPPASASLLEARIALALLLHAGLALVAGLAAWRTRTRAREPIDPGWRLLSFGLAWFYLTLAVESSVVPIVDQMVEHRVYLPSAGIFVAVVASVPLLLQRLTGRLYVRSLVTAALAASLALGFATLLRNRVWFTQLSLWSDAAAKSPRKMRPQLNLGTALVEAGRREAAIEHLRRAAQLAPDVFFVRAQFGAALLATGRVAEAEAELREALRLEPDDLETLFNLAELLHRSGRREEARPLHARFLEIAPPARYADAVRIARARLR